MPAEGVKPRRGMTGDEWMNFYEVLNRERLSASRHINLQTQFVRISRSISEWVFPHVAFDSFEVSTALCGAKHPLVDGFNHISPSPTLRR